MLNSKKYKQRHPLTWFEFRVGKHIIKNNDMSLFSPTILIVGKDHAKAIYASQDRGHRYI